MASLCLFIVLALAVHSQAYVRRDRSDTEMKESLFAELLSLDEPVKRVQADCKTFVDLAPHACSGLVRDVEGNLDQSYCEDHKNNPIVTTLCKRSCSPCGPAPKKAPAQSKLCEDQRDDCKESYTRYQALHLKDPCTEQHFLDYSLHYCRKYCGLCRV